MRRLLHLGLAAVLAAGGALGAVGPASADVPANVATYGSAAYATGVHVIYYTDAYPNFSSGAVDNHYPLARVQQDSSPLADAKATYSDIGPFGQTVTACSDPSQCANRPGVPYANAHYPGGKSKDHVDSCTPSAAASGQASACPTSGQPASYADTSAAELVAAASGYYAGGGTQPFSGAEGDTQTTVAADGTLVVTTHSTVHNAAFAGGAIQISKVEVTTTVRSSGGTATVDAHVTVGQVLVNGQPTNITDQGVTVQQNQVVPCTAVPTAPPIPPPLSTSTPAPAPACVPQVETDTFKVFTVSPKKTTTGGHGTVSASGLHVVVTQPSAPGAPQQHVEYVFGEGYADGQLTPASATAAGTDEGSASDASSFDMSFGDLGGDGTDMGAPDLAGPPTAAPPAAQRVAALVSVNRRPLALLFLFWEAVTMAAAAAWVWARRVRRRLAVEDQA